MIKIDNFFSELGIDEDCVAISLSVPRGMKIRRYNVLAPSWNLLRFWNDSKKDETAWAIYHDRYIKEVLSGLNPHKVAADLNGKVLMCWCKTDRFCHRYIVADWLRHYDHEVQVRGIPSHTPQSKSAAADLQKTLTEVI